MGADRTAATASVLTSSRPGARHEQDFPRFDRNTSVWHLPILCGIIFNRRGPAQRHPTQRRARGRPAPARILPRDGAAVWNAREDQAARFPRRHEETVRRQARDRPRTAERHRQRAVRLLPAALPGDPRRDGGNVRVVSRRSYLHQRLRALPVPSGPLALLRRRLLRDRGLAAPYRRRQSHLRPKLRFRRRCRRV